MKNYSFFCDDAEGYPQYSEVRAFSSVAAAQSHARDMLPEVGRIELWCEGVLIHGLNNTHHPSLVKKAEAAEIARFAFPRTERERTSGRFDFLESSTSRHVEARKIPGRSRSGTGGSSLPAFLPSVWQLLEPQPAPQ